MEETKKYLKTASQKESKVSIYCAGDEKETDHLLSISQNGEIVATCDCGRFLKFSMDITKEELNSLVAAHKEANEGQIKQEELNKKLLELAD